MNSPGILFPQILSHSTVRDEELRGNLQLTEKTLEDLREENRQLSSRVTAQSQQLSELITVRGDLQSRLSMQEVLIQQLQSASSQPTTPTDDKRSDKIGELEGEVSRLLASMQTVRRERDQAVSDVGALREALLNSQQENARKVGVVECS